MGGHFLLKRVTIGPKQEAFRCDKHSNALIQHTGHYSIFESIRSLMLGTMGREREPL
jgi:hypothetical protein